MAEPRHQGDTKTFGQLDNAEQAKSINGMIRSLELAVENHVDNGKGSSEKCIDQLERLIGRLKEKYTK